MKYPNKPIKQCWFTNIWPSYDCNFLKEIIGDLHIGFNQCPVSQHQKAGSFTWFLPEVSEKRSSLIASE